MSKDIFFFYLQDKIEVGQEQMTGAQIKAAIKAVVPSFDLQHELVLEGRGNHPDQVISDTEPVDLAAGHGEGGPKHFFSRPPTNFGFI